MNRTLLLGQLRHAASAAGALLVVMGYTDQAHLDQASNALLALLGSAATIYGFVHSAVNAVKQAAATKP